jgi:hypothetical protein
MIESHSGIASNSVLNVSPIAIALLIGDTQKNNISLFRKVFRFLSCINHHFLNWSFISCDFLPNQDWSLLFKTVKTLSSFQVTFYLFRFIKCVHLFEKYIKILLYFIRCFSSNVLSNLCGHLTWIDL